MTEILLGVSGIALDSGRLLLTRRGSGAYAGFWSLPGGRVEPLEPHESALVREFSEETGLEVAVGRLAGVAEAIEPSGEWHYVIVSYFVDVLGGQLCAGDDAAEVRWVGRGELAGLELTPGLEGYLDRFGCWNT
ncbi:MAG TPA: NUDIX domain-containing protein [Actinomycetota bacterium]|nr:NUDIX domain-containing protein [Actinomycetota bacterium]